jgi:4-carboxymuconolactone decarboxylase
MKTPFAALCLMALLAMPQASRAEDITRFAPLQADELSPAQKAWADAIAVPPRNAKFGSPPYRAYIRNPELAPRLSALSDYLRWNTSLPPRLSEFAILITARQWTAQYEWFAHYPLALKAGLDAKVLGDISAGRRPENMRDDEAALYDLAMALYRDKKVADPVYQAALKKFGERGIMDIIGIMGYYDLVSMSLITMQAGAPNDSVPPLPALAK